MNFNAAFLAAVVLASVSGQGQATPVAINGSFSGLAYDSVAPGGAFDGGIVTGAFMVRVAGTGDFSSPTYTDSIITGTSFSMTLYAGGRTLTFTNPTYLYDIQTFYPAPGGESEMRISGGDASGYHLTLTLFGDILGSSFPSDVRPGPVDMTRSSVAFSGAGFGANTSLSAVSFGDVPGVMVLPEPSTLLLVPMALVAMIRASRRRATVASLGGNPSLPL
jgi:hypothetical protein